MWTLEEGIAVARELEAIANKFNYHIALGGSVLHSGSSEKDLDIFVYPRKTTECDSPENVLYAFGYDNPEARPHVKYGDDKEVYSTERDGRRIDFFFVK